MAFAHPALADELRLINLELRAGKARSEALHNLGERTGVDDVESLVAMLVQTDKFGTSVAQSLRVHSDTLRTKRRQRAEEAAAKTGVKMVFPLVFCIFPAIWVVTIGPAVIKFVAGRLSAVSRAVGQRERHVFVAAVERSRHDGPVAGSAAARAPRGHGPRGRHRRAAPAQDALRRRSHRVGHRREDAAAVHDARAAASSMPAPSG